jgi:hypothetical protein
MLALLATVAALAAPVTGDATNITATTATLNGTDDTASTTTFQYGTTSAYGLTTDPVRVIDGEAHADVTGLTPNTTYHFAIAGGEDKTFRTLPNPKAPTVSNQHATEITGDSAHLSATVNPNGAQTIYYFQYGRTTGYGRRTARLTVPAGTSAVQVEADVSGLPGYTRYHWRLFARNAAGNAPGRDRVLQTKRVATSVTLFSDRGKVSRGRGVTLGGRVTGAGANQMTLALEQQRFPFTAPFTLVRTTRAGSDGGYLFTVDHVWRLTRFRVVTQTPAPLTSAVTSVRVAPRTTIAARTIGRRRARVEGTIRPAITGELSLQRRQRSGAWQQVRRRAITDERSFSFTVQRVRKRFRAFRVVVLPVRGAYVKATTRKVVVSPRPARARGHRAAAG